MNFQNSFLLVLSLITSGLVACLDSSAQVLNQVPLTVSAKPVQQQQVFRTELHCQLYKQPKVGVPGRREGAGTR
ncbi:MAG: hypothetical protein WCA35_20640 [Kovacikia sp.]